MDVSYKQYTFTEGMKLTEQVPFEAKPWVEHLMKTSTLHEEEGWIQGLDSAWIQTTLQDYQTRLESYLKQNHANATVGEVLGTQTIIPAKRPVLAAGLPYQVVAKGEVISELPASLRHAFQFVLYADEAAKTLNAPTLSFERSLPTLSGKRLTFSFEPASDVDRQVIESFLPRVPEGQSLALNQLPTSLPGYLIKLKAELKLDGEVVASGGTLTMGQTLMSVVRIANLQGSWHEAMNRPVAREFYALGIHGAEMSGRQLEQMKLRMERMKTKLEGELFEGVTKDELVGEILSAAVLGYWAANDVNLALLNRGPALAYRHPSFGMFSTNLETVYSF